MCNSRLCWYTVMINIFHVLSSRRQHIHQHHHNCDCLVEVCSHLHTNTYNHFHWVNISAHNLRSSHYICWPLHNVCHWGVSRFCSACSDTELRSCQNSCIWEFWLQKKDFVPVNRLYDVGLQQKLGDSGLQAINLFTSMRRNLTMIEAQS